MSGNERAPALEAMPKSMSLMRSSGSTMMSAARPALISI